MQTSKNVGAKSAYFGTAKYTEKITTYFETNDQVLFEIPKNTVKVVLGDLLWNEEDGDALEVLLLNFSTQSLQMKTTAKYFSIFLFKLQTNTWFT